MATQSVPDRSSSEVMAVGLNTIRELCSRQPLVMTRSLLADLVQYRRHKVKGVMMAARALLAVYREKMPTLLARRERGKGVSEEERQRRDEGEVHDELFGQAEYSVDVAGAELLRQRETEEKEAEGEVDADDAWAMDEGERVTEDGGEDEDEEEEDEQEEMLTNKEVDEFLRELDGDEQATEDREVDSEVHEARDDEAELEHELDAELDEQDEDVEDSEGEEHAGHGQEEEEAGEGEDAEEEGDEADDGGDELDAAEGGEVEQESEGDDKHQADEDEHKQSPSMLSEPTVDSLRCEVRMGSGHSHLT